MNIFDAKRKQYDEMEKYAADQASKRSGPLKEFQSGGVPIAHESVTVIAKPKAGDEMEPDDLKEKVGKMGLLPSLKDMVPSLTEDSDDTIEELRRQLAEAEAKRARGE